MEISVDRQEALPQAAARVLDYLKPHSSPKQATVLALSGELGAGKTTFTKHLASSLGVDEPVQSPTFVIERRYKLPQQAPFNHLIHIDAYRIESCDELMQIGWNELIHTPQILVCIEWPEHILDCLPSWTHWAKIIDTPSGLRTITITPYDQKT